MSRDPIPVEAWDVSVDKRQKVPFIARKRHAEFYEFYEFASFHPFTFCTTTHNSNKVKLDVEIASFSKFMDKENNRSLSSTHTPYSRQRRLSEITNLSSIPVGLVVAITRIGQNLLISPIRARSFERDFSEKWSELAHD